MRHTEILTIKKQEENAIIFIMPGGGQAFGARDLINELKKLNTSTYTATYLGDIN